MANYAVQEYRILGPTLQRTDVIQLSNHVTIYKEKTVKKSGVPELLLYLSGAITVAQSVVMPHISLAIKSFWAVFIP